MWGNELARDADDSAVARLGPRRRLSLLVIVTVLAAAAGGLVVVQAARWLLGFGLNPSLGLLAAATVVLGWLTVVEASAHVDATGAPSEPDWVVPTVRWSLVGVSAGLIGLAALPDGVEIRSYGAAQWVLVVVGALGVAAAVAAPWLVRSGRLDRLFVGAAALLADAPTSSPWMTPAPVGGTGVAWRWSALGAVAMAGAAFLWLVSDGPLGHDESVYAVKGRSWLEGTPDTGFGLHRPVGMAVLARVVMEVSQDEVAFRLVGASFAVIAIAVVLVVGRTLLSPVAGLAGGLLVAGAPSFLRRAPEFLNDIVTLALVLAIVLLLWRHFEEAGTGRWWVVAAAPLAALAFYLRYGVVTALLAVAAVGAVVWRRRLAASWAPLLATAGLLLVLLIPHLVQAIEATGSPIGILTRSSAAAGREFLGEGLLTYLAWFPTRLAGPLVGVVMLVGILGAFVVGLRPGPARPSGRARRATGILVGVAVVHLVVSGLFVHAEPRYVFLSIALLALAGTQVVVAAIGRLTPGAARVGAIVGLLAVAGAFLVNVPRAERVHAGLADARAVIAVAGSEIEAASGPDCTVQTSYLPQITWYSRCATLGFELGGRPTPVPAGDADLVLTFENGKRQPDPELLAELVEAGRLEVVGSIVDEADQVGDATIFGPSAGGR